MGRHSAPDDADAAAAADTAVLSPPEAGPRGRHAAVDSVDSTGEPVRTGAAVPVEADSAYAVPTDEAPTGEVPVAEAPTGELPSVSGRPTVAEAPTGEVPAAGGVDELDSTTADAGPKAAGRPGRATVADASLVRRHRDVQTQLAAAVLVPFALYVVVLIIIGSTVRQGLLWIFVPLVVAGVLVGAFLDAGHKRHAKPTNADDLHES